MNKHYVKYWLESSIFAVSHLEEIKLIQDNKQYKNIHKGERCFVFGNGPSIEDIDFAHFANEYVFTVNQMMRRDNFSLLKTNYHFVADQNYFKLNCEQAEDAELLLTMRSIGDQNNRPVCFFPSNQKKFVQNNKFSEVVDISYFCSPINLLSNNILSTNYAWLIPRFGTVVHFAIAMAIYMGFSEIYLLGCEGTSIIANINSALKKNTIDLSYCYEVNELQKRWLEKVISSKSMEKCAKSFYDMLVGYRRLSEYCTYKQIALFNCTPESVIDSIEYIELNKVLGA